MAMAMKPRKKSKTTASSTANPMSKPKTVTNNTELQSLPLKEPDQPNPLQASTSRERDANRALAKARAQCQQQALIAIRPPSRQPPEIKADTKVNLDAITNDPTAPPELKDKVQQLDQDFNTYEDEVKQAAGKQLSDEELLVLLGKTKHGLQQMIDIVDLAEKNIIGGGGGGGGGGQWYHRLLQWLFDKVSKLYKIVKTLPSKVASLWKRIWEWLKSLISAKKSTPEDGAAEPANLV